MGLLIEWIREYVVSGSQGFTFDIGEVGISFNFLTPENLSTDLLANGYLPGDRQLHHKIGSSHTLNRAPNQVDRARDQVTL